MKVGLLILFLKKNYQDIRVGDSLKFRINQEYKGWETECKTLGINPKVPMLVKIGRVNFAPNVHSMYQNFDCEGEDFQPLVNGPGEIFNIQRAAVYYSFPGYRDLIGNYGFIGLKMGNPVLLNESQISSVETTTRD